MARARDGAISRLRDVGLNQLEAEVYAYLLPHEPATAYAVGRAIGRPTANVYKAVEQLSRLGAVMVEEGDHRLCRAVPIREFIDHTHREFERRLRAADGALSALEKESYDERVYRIEAVPEVVSRAIGMLDRAEVVAVVDAFPRSLRELAPAVERAVGRGVDVFVEAYEAIRIDGADVVVVAEGERSLKAWRSEQLNLVVDGREHLMALLGEDLGRVHQAIWSRSLYLSCMHHAGRMAEIELIRRIQAPTEGGGEGPKERLAEPRFFRNSRVPGHEELLRRFTPSHEGGDPEEPGGTI